MVMERKNLRLDDLFRVSARVEVFGKTFYLRALSDLDLQEREMEAMLAGAEMREALYDPESRPYKVFTLWMNHADDDMLKRVVVGAETTRLARESFTAVPYGLYPFPDDADDKEKAEVLAKRKAEDERVGQARKDYIDANLKPVQEKLEGMEHDKLLAFARQMQIDFECRNASMQAFNDYTIYAATFADEACRERVFLSPRQVNDLAPQAKSELLRLYFAEVDRVTAEDLKYFFSTDASPDSSKP